MSNGGTVIKIPVEDVKRLGRSTQGVIVMRLRGEEQVSTLATVVEQEPNGDSTEDVLAEASEGATEAAEQAAEDALVADEPDVIGPVETIDEDTTLDPEGEPGADEIG
jgi:DNA gyrase/topoisomerase IV subunit A